MSFRKIQKKLRKYNKMSENVRKMKGNVGKCQNYRKISKIVRKFR